MHAIIWPEGYIADFSDRFASNEVIVAGLWTVGVRPCLSNTAAWPTYSDSAADIVFHDGSGPELHAAANLHARRLFDEHHVCAMRRAHPPAAEPLSR